MFNPSNVFEQTYNRSFPGVNYRSTSLKHGSVVCADVDQTDSDAFVQVARRQSGIAAPESGNVHRLLGILQVRSGRKVLESGQGGQVVWHGAAKALVWVPANIALNAGTPLALRTTWDSANNVVDFTPDDSSSLAYGTLAPINYAGSTVIGEWAQGSHANDAPLPDNPVATLLENVNSSSTARVVEAWVDVLGPHKPLPFEFVARASTISQFTDGPIKLLAGSGVITGAWLQVGVTGTSGATTLDVTIAPAGPTPDVQSVFSAPLTIDSAQADGTIVGVGAVLDGNADTDTAPTGSTDAGTLKALANRQFPNEGLIKTAMTFASGVGAPYGIGIRGFIY